LRAIIVYPPATHSNDLFPPFDIRSGLGILPLVQSVTLNMGTAGSAGITIDWQLRANASFYLFQSLSSVDLNTLNVISKYVSIYLTVLPTSE
jgi:hypothetical protein